MLNDRSFGPIDRFGHADVVRAANLMAGTHLVCFEALSRLQYGPAKAGFRLKAGLQTSARVFVVPSFSPIPLS